jgi:hypothetical protein
MQHLAFRKIRHGEAPRPSAVRTCQRSTSSRTNLKFETSAPPNYETLLALRKMRLWETNAQVLIRRILNATAFSWFAKIIHDLGYGYLNLRHSDDLSAKPQFIFKLMEKFRACEGHFQLF